MSETRRLAAILAADVVGYSRLIGADESGTIQAFNTIKAELFGPAIAAHHGRLVKMEIDCRRRGLCHYLLPTLSSAFP
jgi:adenylate cyclase